MFPYCMTWLVLVWVFTSWYCLCSVSLVKSSCRKANSESLGRRRLEAKLGGQPALRLTMSESSIQLTLYQSPRYVDLCSS